MPLAIRTKAQCRWDILSLGEIMIRFDPGPRRIWTTRSFDVCEGGGEYDVSRGLKRCFGLDAAHVTAFADNPVGRLLQDLIYQGGVDQTLHQMGRVRRHRPPGAQWPEFHRARLRCPRPVGMLRPRPLRGVTVEERRFRLGRDLRQARARAGSTPAGIFCALSESTPDLAIEAMTAARKHGAIVSYDLNYRESLWKAIGGKKRAQEVNRRLAPLVDVMIGNEEDFSASLGFEVPGMDEHILKIETESFKKMIESVLKEFPFKVVATTLRKAKSASTNDWSAICYAGGKYYESKRYENLEIYDRVGGGDSFASGLIYGFLTGQDPQWAVDCGVAHGALAMTTPGDTTMATLKEVTAADARRWSTNRTMIYDHR